MENLKEKFDILRNTLILSFSGSTIRRFIPLSSLCVEYGARVRTPDSRSEFYADMRLLSIFSSHSQKESECVCYSRCWISIWMSSDWPYLSPLERRFWVLFGLLSLPRHGAPLGPVTRTDSSPLDDFLKVNSTASPSLRLRKPSMCSLLC